MIKENSLADDYSRRLAHYFGTFDFKSLKQFLVVAFELLDLALGPLNVPKSGQLSSEAIDLVGQLLDSFSSLFKVARDTDSFSILKTR